jgi:hypothetical protein
MISDFGLLAYTVVSPVILLHGLTTGSLVTPPGFILHFIIVSIFMFSPVSC